MVDRVARISGSSDMVRRIAIAQVACHITLMQILVMIAVSTVVKIFSRN